MKSDRLGLLMIAASVVVVAAIMAVLHSQHSKLYRDKVRTQGVAMARALSGAELSQLLGEKNLVSKLASVQGSDALAYATVVTKSGDKLFEFTSPGSIVPSATMPLEPAAWFGEQPLVSPGDGRQIREFFGPVLSRGELVGFVRLGYYDALKGLPIIEISYVALFALPIFLLTAFSYIMIRQEIRPLAGLTRKLEDAGKMYGIELGFPRDMEFRQLAQRFDQFMQIVLSRVHDMDRQRLEAETSRRLLSYRQEKAQAILDAMPDAVLVVDEAGVPTFANPKVAMLLGIDAAELIGQPAQKWCTRPELLALLPRLSDHGGEARHATTVEYCSEGSPERRISVSAYPLFSPRERSMVFGMLLVFRDQTEEYLARHAGEEFVAQVSHELKTPLTTIATYSDLLLEYGKLADQDRVEAVNGIRNEVERAVSLITNMLNVSKLESGNLPIERQRVKIQELLHDIAASIGECARAKDLRVELNIAPDLGSARLDKELFRIAVDNVVSNAVKYGRPGGRVVLSAERLADERMKISVKDDGIGISPEDAERVFDKYYRSSSKEVSAHGGHGLGLYLAKRIVELHHGTISLQSEPGKGTEFSIVFEAQVARLEALAQA